MAHAPPVSRDGFSFAADCFSVTTSGGNVHRRCTIPELKEHFKKSTAGAAAKDDRPAHWYEAQLLHYGLPPSKVKGTAKLRLMEAVGAKLAVPAPLVALERELKKEWTKANKVSSTSGETTGVAAAASRKRKAATTSASAADVRIVAGDGANVSVAVTFMSAVSSQPAPNKKAKTEPQTKPKATSGTASKTTTSKTTTSKATATKATTAKATTAKATTAKVTTAKATTVKATTTKATAIKAAATKATATKSTATKKAMVETKTTKPKAEPKGKAATPKLPAGARKPIGPKPNPTSAKGKAPPAASSSGKTASFPPPTNPNRQPSQATYDDPPPPYPGSPSGSARGGYYGGSHHGNQQQQQQSSPPSSSAAPLGLLNGRYEIVACDDPPAGYRQGAAQTMVCTLDGDGLWVYFDLGFLTGTMRTDSRPRRASGAPLALDWVGRSGHFDECYDGASRRRRADVAFLGSGLVEAEVAWVNGQSTRFTARRAAGQGTRSDMDARTMRELWDRYWEGDSAGAGGEGGYSDEEQDGEDGYGARDGQGDGGRYDDRYEDDEGEMYDAEFY